MKKTILAVVLLCLSFHTFAEINKPVKVPLGTYVEINEKGKVHCGVSIKSVKEHPTKEGNYQLEVTLYYRGEDSSGIANRGKLRQKLFTMYFADEIYYDEKGLIVNEGGEDNDAMRNDGILKLFIDFENEPYKYNYFYRKGYIFPKPMQSWCNGMIKIN